MRRMNVCCCMNPMTLLVFDRLQHLFNHVAITVCRCILFCLPLPLLQEHSQSSASPGMGRRVAHNCQPVLHFCTEIISMAAFSHPPIAWGTAWPFSRGTGNTMQCLCHVVYQNQSLLKKKNQMLLWKGSPFLQGFSFVSQAEIEQAHIAQKQRLYRLQ